MRLSTFIILALIAYLIAGWVGVLWLIIGYAALYILAIIVLIAESAR